jgi:orotidine-5'-phosphate decarboxylase
MTRATEAAGHFADRLLAAIRRAGSPAGVGLDPVLEKLPQSIRARHSEPAAAITAFGRGVLEAIAPYAGVVKLQSACFERYGAAGVRALEETAARAVALGLIVVLDAKRGDIGISAEHYAAAAAALGADAVTVNAYLGPGTLEPFLAAGLGLFVLVRTSNPDSDAVQSLELTDGRTVAEMMADHVAALGRRSTGAGGYSDVGAVVGATKAADGRALRLRMPDQIFLVPGYGAQGGTAADIRAMLDDRGGGVLVTASRSVIYAFEPDDETWPAAVAAAAAGFAAELKAIAP